MEQFDFWDGLTGLQRRLVDLLRSMAESETVFIGAKDILRRLATEEWKMTEDEFEYECEEMNIQVGPIESYRPKSVGRAYRLLLEMGAPWRIRYPYFDLRGMVGTLHDDAPSGPDGVSLRLSPFAQMVLPVGKAPLLPAALLNGVSLPDGSHIPPHNLQELWMALEAVRQNPGVELDDLMEVLPGPDFASGGVVGGAKAIRSLYADGKTEMVLRGKIEAEIEGGRTRVAIMSLPPGVLVRTIIEQIRGLAGRERLFLYEMKDRSERHAVRITLDLPRRYSAAAVKEILYRETDLERRGVFRLSVSDGSGRPGEGTLISILKGAVLCLSPAWERKDGAPTDSVPFLKEILEVGGYKSPLSDLTDDRRSRLLDLF